MSHPKWGNGIYNTTLPKCSSNLTKLRNPKSQHSTILLNCYINNLRAWPLAISNLLLHPRPASLPSGFDQRKKKEKDSNTNSQKFKHLETTKPQHQITNKSK
eukprot:TRINITY_DN27008_c0_g1_i3.p1 TRINITY_DN27008_c0_g1~~TRINITY_DN27008_c0_g1_i3.p1  ORF type:complete len:102 (+),score=8.34 TRINITY_DN27008_c0_g1_i3:659-964(+)